MPTYGYRCTKCSTEFEAWERMADPPAGRCPACGAKGKRLFFPTGIVFKGSGFYKTDSRSSDGGPAAHRAPAAGDSKEKAATDTAAAASESRGSGDKPSGAGGASGDSAPEKRANKEPTGGSTPAAKPSGDQPKGRPRR